MDKPSQVSHLFIASILVCLLEISLVRSNDKIQAIQLTMPGVLLTRQQERSICTFIELDPELEYNILGFQPMVNHQNIHHMSVVAAKSLELKSREHKIKTIIRPNAINQGKEKLHQEAFACSAGVGYASDRFQSLGGVQTLYQWGRAGGNKSLLLPPGVSFKVGKRTGHKLLILQIHYHNHDILKPGGVFVDTSGVLISFTDQPQKKTAGIKSLHAGGIIGPRNTTILETSCPLAGRQSLYPLMFLVHTHSHGTWASLWTRPGPLHDQWKLLGEAEPYHDQQWRPVDSQLRLDQDDILVTRCSLRNNDERLLRTGPTADDEMCAGYLLYQVDGDDRMANFGYCLTV